MRRPLSCSGFHLRRLLTLLVRQRAARAGGGFQSEVGEIQRHAHIVAPLGRRRPCSTNQRIEPDEPAGQRTFSLTTQSDTTHGCYWGERTQLVVFSP
jgi:hypothetical protein